MWSLGQDCPLTESSHLPNTRLVAFALSGGILALRPPLQLRFVVTHLEHMLLVGRIILLKLLRVGRVLLCVLDCLVGSPDAPHTRKALTVPLTPELEQRL